MERWPSGCLFCIQNYFHWAVACVGESFYNKNARKGWIYPMGATIKHIYC
ncbi:hypothetical protein HMPREF9163_01892 [Selenomonas sp. oral taxon 138 str. F0429]|nr:hypothetical protein HMPREF9163_01892 [Selenomonas sp. oral taxon 138 str. F0429]